MGKRQKRERRRERKQERRERKEREAEMSRPHTFGFLRVPHGYRVVKFVDLGGD